VPEDLQFVGLLSHRANGKPMVRELAGQWFSQFTYDGKMRRRIRQEFTWQGSAWVQTNEVYYVYDGNLVIQERDVNNLPTVTYTRGKDLNGSLEGAGGIGGLLSMTLNTGPGSLSSNSMFYHCDGNGNVTMLINPSQAIVAKYLYDAFGNTLSAAGSLAQANLYRFSSKEEHPNSGLIYYLYRYYDPNLQRWPNRDPIAEVGGINLYDFARNDSIGHVDYLGQDAAGGPLGMLGYGLFGPPDTSLPLSSAFIDQAKKAAYGSEENLMSDLRPQLKCGQSGDTNLSQYVPNIGVGSTYTGNWQMNLNGHCHWACEKPGPPPQCCCNCLITCTFSDDFSKTWTFMPGYNPRNTEWPFTWLFGATLGIQSQLYHLPGGMYFMSGDFTDSISLPVRNVCPGK
jgi:RHS repeat-associated protein